MREVFHGNGLVVQRVIIRKLLLFNMYCC
jgi:hypothetical protein